LKAPWMNITFEYRHYSKATGTLVKTKVKKSYQLLFYFQCLTITKLSLLRHLSLLSLALLVTSQTFHLINLISLKHLSPILSLIICVSRKKYTNNLTQKRNIFYHYYILFDLRFILLLCVFLHTQKRKDL